MWPWLIVGAVLAVLRVVAHAWRRWQLNALRREVDELEARHGRVAAEHIRAALATSQALDELEARAQRRKRRRHRESVLAAARLAQQGNRARRAR